MASHTIPTSLPFPSHTPLLTRPDQQAPSNVARITALDSPFNPSNANPRSILHYLQQPAPRQFTSAMSNSLQQRFTQDLTRHPVYTNALNIESATRSLGLPPSFPQGNTYNPRFSTEEHSSYNRNTWHYPYEQHSLHQYVPQYDSYGPTFPSELDRLYHRGVFPQPSYSHEQNFRPQYIPQRDSYGPIFPSELDRLYHRGAFHQPSYSHEQNFRHQHVPQGDSFSQNVLNETSYPVQHSIYLKPIIDPENQITVNTHLHEDLLESPDTSTQSELKNKNGINIRNNKNTPPWTEDEIILMKNRALELANLHGTDFKKTLTALFPRHSYESSKSQLKRQSRGMNLPNKTNAPRWKKDEITLMRKRAPELLNLRENELKPTLLALFPQYTFYASKSQLRRQAIKEKLKTPTVNSKFHKNLPSDAVTLTPIGVWQTPPISSHSLNMTSGEEEYASSESSEYLPEKKNPQKRVPPKVLWTDREFEVIKNLETIRGILGILGVVESSSSNNTIFTQIVNKALKEAGGLHTYSAYTHLRLRMIREGRLISAHTINQTEGNESSKL